MTAANSAPPCMHRSDLSIDFRLSIHEREKTKVPSDFQASPNAGISVLMVGW